MAWMIHTPLRTWTVPCWVCQDLCSPKDTTVENSTATAYQKSHNPKATCLNYKTPSHRFNWEQQWTTISVKPQTETRYQDQSTPWWPVYCNAKTEWHHWFTGASTQASLTSVIANTRISWWPPELQNIHLNLWHDIMASKTRLHVVKTEFIISNNTQQVNPENLSTAATTWIYQGNIEAKRILEENFGDEIKVTMALFG